MFLRRDIDLLLKTSTRPLPLYTDKVCPLAVFSTTYLCPPISAVWRSTVSCVHFIGRGFDCGTLRAYPAGDWMLRIKQSILNGLLVCGGKNVSAFIDQRLSDFCWGKVGVFLPQFCDYFRYSYRRFSCHIYSCLNNNVLYTMQLY